MKLYKRLHLIILALAVAACLLSMHSCATPPASEVVKPIAEDWKGVTDRGTFTAPELNHHSDVIVEAQKKAALPPAVPAAIKAAPNLVISAASGDWIGLAAQVAGVLAAAGGAGIVTYKKVMADRDATSAERTKEEVAQLGVPIHPPA